MTAVHTDMPIVVRNLPKKNRFRTTIAVYTQLFIISAVPFLYSLPQTHHSKLHFFFNSFYILKFLLHLHHHLIYLSDRWRSQNYRIRFRALLYELSTLQNSITYKNF